MEAARLEVIIDGDNSGANRALDQTNQKVNRTASDFAVAGGIWTGVGLGIGKGIVGMIGTAADFEAQMSAVKSVTGASADEMKDFEKDILDLGSSSQFSALEVGQAYEMMAKAGVRAEDMTKETAQGFLDLAAATDTDLVKATEVGATAMVQFGVTSTEAADIISQSANASALDVNDWALALKSAGPIASSLGIPMEDLAAGMMILADNGIKGEVAATSLRNILTSLGAPTADQAQALNELGVSSTYANGEFKGLDTIMTEMMPTWKGLNDEQKLYYAEQIAGKDGAAAFLALMNEQEEALDKGTSAFEERKKAMQGVGTAEEQARTRMDNFNGAMEEFSGALETASIILGGVFLPILKVFVQFLTNALSAVIEWFVNLSPAMQKVIGGLLALSAAIPLVVGGFLLLKSVLKTGFVKSFLSISAPILLVIAALAALGVAVYLAYKHFEPFRNAVDSVLGVLKDFGSYLKEVWTSGNVMNDAMKKLPKPLQAVAKHVGRVVDAFADLKRAFDRGGIKELLRQLPRELAQIGRAFRDLGREIWNAIRSIDWGSVARNVLNGIRSAFNAVPWSTIFDTLKNAGAWVIGAIGAIGVAVGTWVWDQLSSIDWIGAFTAALDVLGDIAGVVVDKLGDWATAIGSWFQEQLASVDWLGYLTTAVDTLSGFAADLGDWALNVAAPAILGWLANAAGNVWESVKSAAGWAWDNLADLGAWTLDVAIPAITGWVVDNADDVWGAIKSAAGWVWDGIADLGAWTLQVALPAIGGIFGLAPMGTIKSLILSKIKDLSANLARWVLHVALPKLDGVGKDDIAKAILNKLKGLVVDLADWTLSVDGRSVGVKIAQGAALIAGIGAAVLVAIGAGVTLGAALPIIIPAIAITFGVLAMAGAMIAVWNWWDSLTFEQKLEILIAAATIVDFGNDIKQGIEDEVNDWLSPLGVELELEWRDIPIIREYIRAWETLETVIKAVAYVIREVRKEIEFLKDTWEDLEDTLTAPWRYAKEEIVKEINAIIDAVNFMIKGFNKLPGEDIPLIPKIGEEAKASEDAVKSLTNAMNNLQTAMAGGISGALRYAELQATQTAQDRPVGQTGGAGGGGGGGGGMKTPIGEMPQLSQGGLFGNIRNEALQTTKVITAETGKWGGVVGTNAARLPTAAIGGFMGVTSAASTGLAPVNGVIRSTLGSAVGVAATALTGLGSTANVSFSAVPLSATSQLGGLGSLVGGYVSAASSASALQLAGMGLGATAAFMAIPTAASTQLSGLGTAVGGYVAGASLAASAALLGMGLAASVQFAAVPAAATTNLGSLGSLVGGYAMSAASSAATGFSSLSSHARTHTASAAASVASNLAQAASSAASNTASMAASVGKNAASMAANAIKSATQANTTTSAQMLGMQLGATLASATMKSNVTSNANAMQSAVNSAAMGAANAMRIGMQAASNAVSSAASSWAGYVRSGGGAAAATAAGIGANIGASLAAGIRSMYGAVAAAADALVAQADRAMRARARIASPSKMTRYFGEMLGEGFVVGMNDMQRDVARAASDLAASSLVEPAYESDFSANPFGQHVDSRAVSINNTTNVYQTNTYYVEVDDLEDLNMAVEFVKDLPRERELVFAT